MSAGASLQVPLGPVPLPGFKRAASRQEGNGGEEREGLGEGKRGREGKGRMGKGREKGEVGGIAPWLLGIDAPGRKGFLL